MDQLELQMFDRDLPPSRLPSRRSRIVLCLFSHDCDGRQIKEHVLVVSVAVATDGLRSQVGGRTGLSMLMDTSTLGPSALEERDCDGRSHRGGGTLPPCSAPCNCTTSNTIIPIIHSCSSVGVYQMYTDIHLE